MSERPRLHIEISGPLGSGKTTLATVVYNALRKFGFDVVTEEKLCDDSRVDWSALQPAPVSLSTKESPTDERMVPPPPHSGDDERKPTQLPPGSGGAAGWL